MTTTARALGRLFDIGVGAVPVDTDTAAITGARIDMRNAGGITFVLFTGAGTAANDIGVDVQQYTASTGGTTADLDVVTTYYHKSEATLDNDESWVAVTQTAASEITEIGGAGISGESQILLVIEVGADQLSDGYTHVGLNVTDPGAAKLGCVLYILHDLKEQRTPANLPNLLNPGAADV